MRVCRESYAQTPLAQTGWKAVSLGRLSPQQGRDAVNCGVMLLASCWALAAGVSLTAIHVRDQAHWRMRFLVWLLDGGRSLLQAAGSCS